MSKPSKVTIKEEEYVSKYAAYRKSQADEEKPVDAKKTLFRFFALIKPQSVQMAIVVISALAQALLNVIAPEWYGNIINALQDQVTGIANGTRTGGVNFLELKDMLIQLAAIYIAITFFSFLQEFVAAGVSQKLVCGLRDKVNVKLSHLPLSYYDKQTKGEVISKVINDIQNVSSSLQSSILTLLTGIIQCVGALVMMIATGNIFMIAVSIILVPVSAGVSYKVSRISKKWFRRYWNTMGDMNGHIEEMYAGHTIVRLFGHEKQSTDEFENITRHLGHNSFMANIISGILNPILSLIKNLNYVGLSVVGGYLVLNKTKFGAIGGIGDIQKFLSYSSYFSTPIVNISKMLNSIQSALASAERVFSLLDEPEETAEVRDNDREETALGHIEFKDVSFRYVEDRPLIDNLNIDAKPGSVTAIVGPTGAGKTTIVNLLMRFYDVNSGKILLDGIDINTMSRDCLRKNFGMVLQDTWLFKGTVKENIKYGNDLATDEQIEEAAKAAQIYDYIMSLPEGFDTELAEEGSNLSQGQRQLLTIARAIVSDPAVLILDEATSSVDTKTEQKIQVAMNTLMQGRTSFVIAHRLSTIKNADNILVMKKGAIVEQGTHDELLKADGFYALLYNSQYTDGIPPED